MELAPNPHYSGNS